MNIKTEKSSIIIPAILSALFLLAAAPVAKAANTYTWDPSQNKSGSNGGGTWNTGNTFWALSGADYAGSSITTADTAAFGVSGATGPYSVTLDSGVTTAAAISFNYPGYTISGTWNLSSSGGISLTSGSGGSGTASIGTISATIQGNTTGGFVKFGNNTYPIVLSGNNTFDCNGFQIRQGILSISSINSVTTPAQMSSSSLGKPASAAHGAIQLGYNTYTGTLIYTGVGETSDRNFTIGTTGGGGGGTIENDGSGAIIFTGTFTTAGTSSRTLTLQGTDTHLNEIKSALADTSSSITLSLTKAQAGTWILSGANTYNGSTTISGGTLKISGDGNLGTAPSSPTAGNLVINNATLEITSPMTLNANRGIALGATSGTVNGFLQLDSGANLAYAGIMANNGAGTGNLYLSATVGATLTLSGPSTFTGNVLNRGNILSVASINTVGTVVNSALPGGQSTHQSSSNLGAPTSASTGSIQLGYNAYTGTLLYTGSGEGSDRNIIIGNTPNGGTGGGAIIQNDGTGPLVFSGTFSAGGAIATASHNKTLTLQGSSTGANQIASAIPDGAANGSFTAITSLTKAGGGTWQLTAANTYSGNTTVKGGTLLVNNSSGSGTGSGTTVTVGGSSASGTPKLGGSGTISGTVSISSAGGGAAGHLAPGAGGTAATLNTGALTLGNTVNLDYRLNTPDSAGGAGGNDYVNVTGNLTINPNVTLTVTPGANIGPGKYHIIKYSGNLTDNSSSFNGWNMTGVSGKTATFSVDNVNNYIDVTFGPKAVADTYPRAPGTGLKIYASDLLANDVVASGYTATYVSCDGTSANGVTLGTSGTGNSNIIVYPGSAGNSADSFTYTINDGHGGTATGTVTITVNNNVTGQASINLVGQTASVGFFGIPGYHYVVQRSVDSVNSWADLTSVTTANVVPSGTSVDGNGVITAPSGAAFTVTDPSPPVNPTSVFYQLRAAP